MRARDRARAHLLAAAVKTHRPLERCWNFRLQMRIPRRASCKIGLRDALEIELDGKIAPGPEPIRPAGRPILGSAHSH